MNFTAPRARLRLRKFPYPYRATLTILSDRHGVQSADEFRAFHKFLNTTADTPHGRGLGLEIGDTFWFFDGSSRFSYFSNFTNTPSPQAPIIRDYYRAGYIDCLHTWGDFTDVPFERKYAQWAVDESLKQSLQLPIWVNHGNRHNTQNLNFGISYHQGATLGSPSYHADLARAAGLKFLWRSLTPVIGQDRPLHFREFVDLGNERDFRMSTYAARQVAKRLAMAADRLLGTPLGWHEPYRDNRLLRPARLDDNQEVYEFHRFNNHATSVWDGMHAGDLVRQIARPVIDALIKVEGYMIVYNHLEYGEFYHPDVISALRSVALRQQAGDLWVTTTAQMFRYNLAHRHLSWQEKFDDEGGLTIVIDSSYSDPVLGATPVTAADLEGLTFLVPKDSAAISFTLNGRTVPHVVFERAPVGVIGFPVGRLMFPE